MAMTEMNYPNSGGGVTLNGYEADRVTAGLSKTITQATPIRFIAMSNMSDVKMYSYCPDYDENNYVINNAGSITTGSVGTGNIVESISADHKTVTLHASNAATLLYSLYY